MAIGPLRGGGPAPAGMGATEGLAARWSVVRGRARGPGRGLQTPAHYWERHEPCQSNCRGTG